MIGHIDHGKTTLLEKLTGKWADTHSEEMKRGITIKLGYANCFIRKCPECPHYTTSVACMKHDEKTKIIRGISFVDAPGHETLMAIMLSGAAIMDGAILVIAANEQCPQPQTREHLMALDIIGINNIVIVQNKIDLVSEEQALKNYKQIKEFVKGSVAEDAPIIPVSAQQGVNIDVLLDTVQEVIPSAEKKLDKKPIMLVARSFDVNSPGKDVNKLVGCVLGGALKQGKIKVGDEVSILPGRQVEEKNKIIWEPIHSIIENINYGNNFVKEAVPGGNFGLATSIDPYYGKGDKLAGNVVCMKEKPISVFDKLDLEVHLLDKIIGASEELKVDNIKINEKILISAWTSRMLGTVTSVSDNKISIILRKPLAILKGERIALSRRINNKWRLIGWGIIL